MLDSNPYESPKTESEPKPPFVPRFDAGKLAGRYLQILASLSIVSQFLWLPHYPVWAIVVIALDIFVIWAVATWESPAARAARERPVSAIGAQPGSRWPELSQWLGGFPSWPALFCSTRVIWASRLCSAGPGAFSPSR